MSLSVMLSRVVVILILLGRRAQTLHAFTTTSLSLETTRRHSKFKLRNTISMMATPVNEGFVNVQRGNDECKLAYRVVRPMSLSSRQAAPMIVLHGGPSVPSNYLYPLADHVPYRSIVFHDQIGCGTSSEPDDVSLYSIDAAVDDLEALLKKLGVNRFHLYGQSYGGIVAFEYMKRLAENGQDNVECLSAILSSTPTCISQVEQEADRLLSTLSTDGMNDENLAEAFQREHQCRTETMPQPLVDAYANAGTVWRGSSAIANYKAEPPCPDAARMPSCMILRGEFDFVTEACVEGWKDCFNHPFVRFKVLNGCSHHALLENGFMYGEVVDSFFAEYD